MKQITEQLSIQKTEQDVSLKQRLALEALQKTIQVLNLKEALFLISFSLGGALLRIPMQSVPSAEPITFFAILAGWLFGRYKGAAVGASSLYISNYFMFGGHGPWSLFQAIGFGAAGYLGGFLRDKAKWYDALIVAAGSTLIFEIIMNGYTALSGANIFIAFFFALPFLAVHMISNLIFALFLPKARKLVWEKGGFDEKKLCMDALSSMRGHISDKHNWLSGFKRAFQRKR